MSGMKKCEESRDSSFFKKRVAVTDLTEDFIFTLNVSVPKCVFSRELI